MFLPLQVNPNYDISNIEFLVALLCAFVIGISKSGIKGIGIVIVTVMALIFGSKASTGLILVLFSVGDIMAVTYYRRHAKWKYLIQLMPWMIAGILLGAFIGKDLPEAVFKKGMAFIILISVIMMFWWEKFKSKAAVPEHWLFGGSMGFTAGFTTMVGNLAGSFVNIFFLAMRLPKNEFIGTAAWLYFFVNIFKFPFHYFVWETINYESLSMDLKLIPATILGFWVGTKIVAKINEKLYRNMILVLTAIGAILIFFK